MRSIGMILVGCKVLASVCIIRLEVVSGRTRKRGRKMVSLPALAGKGLIGYGWNLWTCRSLLDTP
jgi:hypothetical protein